MSSAQQVVFDAFLPEHRSNPYPRYALVRDFAALYPITPNILMATRYAECSAVFTDPLWGHGYEDGISPFRPGVDPDDVPGSMLRMDPPNHTRVRGLTNRAFIPRNTQQGMRSRVEGVVNELLDKAIEAGEVDLMKVFARPLPLTIIGDMVGIPREDHPVIQQWSLEIVRGTDPDILQSPETLARRPHTMREFEAYFADLLTQRRKDPKDDILTGICEAEDRGELSGREPLGLAVGLVLGGYETISDLIGKGVVALLRNPDQIARWLADPEIAEPAVDELLRYDPPVQFTHRVALAEREVAGHTFARGEGIVILTASANRDPAVYADPDRLDITRFAGRTPPPRHLSFSEGLHFCLGSHLGRLETAIAMDTLLRRAPELSLTDEPAWRNTVAIHGLDTLPVRLRG